MAVLRSAATRVFGVNELVESILVHLSPLDLLRSRRVARSWKDNIDGSMVLQNTAYPEAEEPKAAWIIDNSIWGPTPLLEQTFGAQVMDCIRFSALSTRESTPLYAQSARFNRLLLQRPSDEIPRDLSERTRQGERLAFNEQACRVSFCDERPLSCDNMHLADVPVYDVDVLVECDCEKSHMRGFLGRHHVLRMKDVREYLRKYCPSPRRVQLIFMEAGYGVEGRNQGIVFPTGAERDWVKKHLHLDL